MVFSTKVSTKPREAKLSTMAPRLLGAVIGLALIMTSAACSLGYGAGAYGIRGAGNVRVSPPTEVTNTPRAEQVEISGSPGLRIEDDRVLFEWTVSPQFLLVRITNKSSRQDPGAESLVVQLESAEFVDPEGRTYDLSPVHWLKKNPSNVIPPGKGRVYSFFPTEYEQERRALFGGPVPNFVAESPEGIQAAYAEHVGKQFRIRLPVQMNGISYEYDFTVTVSKIRPVIVRDIF